MSRIRFDCQCFFICCLLVFARSSAQDLNNDGLFNCGDADLISAAILEQSNDLAFDLNMDGTVNPDDLTYAMDLGGFVQGDANFDGAVDRLDFNAFGLHWQQPVISYCQGDFFLDGFVDTNDSAYIGINWQHGTPGVNNNAPPANVNLPELPGILVAWQSDGVVFADAGPLELVAIPQRAPDGLLSTVVAIRTKDPTDRIATFDDIEFSGDAHQIWLPGSILQSTPTGIQITATHPDLAGIGRWNQGDTQLLLRGVDVGVGAGLAFAGVNETNDASEPVDVEPIGIDTLIPPYSGIGSTGSTLPTDVFVLRPDQQTNYVEFAQLVTPADRNDESDGVFLKVGVQGGDADQNPLPFHDVIGKDEPVRIPFYAEPCDFNADGYCDHHDLDRLTVAAANGVEDLELNLDASNPPRITESDITAWENQSDPIPGDTDYDGDVDAADLNNLGVNWRRNSSRFSGIHLVRWEDGDFDYSSDVDAVDLTALGINWQQGVQPQGAIVPEPGSHVLAWLCLAFVVARRQGSFCQRS